MKRISGILVALLLACYAAPVSAQGTEPQAAARAVMFWMSGCPHCEDVIANVLPPLHEKYGAQFELLMIEVVDADDIKVLMSVAASYDIPKEETGVPLLVIGDQVLVGSDQVREQLPGLIEDHLSQGGVDWPANPLLTDLLPGASSQTPDLSPANEASPAADRNTRNNGFTLAIIIMIGMGITLLYSIITFATGRTLPSPEWTQWLVPILLMLGFGVAGYLSYIETQAVEAICGPIGDCNTVQQSRYARLFDILPVGLFGLMGYVALLAAWLGGRYFPALKKTAAIAFFGMAFFAVLFSLYLTYLEPFVIKAVCIWCLSSAVISTLLLILGTPPAIQQFARLNKD